MVNADESEVSLLADGLKLSVLVALERGSLLRWPQPSAYDELVYRLQIVSSTEKMTGLEALFESITRLFELVSGV